MTSEAASQLCKAFFVVLTSVGSLTACGDKPQTTPSIAESQTVESAPKEPSIQTKNPTIEPSDDIKETSAKTQAISEVVLAEDAGQKRYEITCSICHGQGLLDAPKLSDKATWQPRIAKGKETLYQHSINGFNKMPAQAVGDVSELEVRAAVDYIIGQVS